MSLTALPSASALAKKKELNLYAKDWMTDAQACSLAGMFKGNTATTFLGFRECKRVGDKGACSTRPWWIARGCRRLWQWWSGAAHRRGAQR